VVATSGSVKDGEIVEYCRENGIVLYHIPDKKARGFFGH
jgi:AICAR transformylase/IMP cyclohydrolase PurH